MTCQNCGKEIENGSQFCLYCGQKVEVTYKCVSCGSVIHEGDTFCMSCGWKVNMSEIAAKAAEEEEKRKEAEIAAAKVAEEERKRKEAEVVAAKAAEEEERKRKEVEIAAAKAAEEERKRKEAEIAAAKAKKKNSIAWIILGLVVVSIIATLFMENEEPSNSSISQEEVVLTENSMTEETVSVEDENNEDKIDETAQSEELVAEEDSEYDNHICWEFTGLIDNQYPISGYLGKSDSHSFYGGYYYDKNGPENQLSIEGKYNDDGTIILKEYNNDKKNTGTFICDEYDKSMTYIRGTFVVEKTGKRMPFQLTLTEEELDI